MKRAFFLLVLLIPACAPRAVDQTPHPAETLHSYSTQTPSVTPGQPEGLVVSFEAPLPSPTPFFYIVQSGETLSSIAEKFGVSLDDLRAANPDISPNSMSISTKLKIPSIPANPSSAFTPTPVPAPVKQIECYPTVDQGLWCFVLVTNDLPDTLENLSAQVTLLDADGGTLVSAPAISPLNTLPPGASLPLTVFFPPDSLPNSGKVPLADVKPQAQLLAGIRLLPDDARYLPATLHNTLVQVDGSGRSAQVNGTVRLPDDVDSARLIWVAAVAYDQDGRVVGVRRWESATELAAGDSLPFAFSVSSLAGEIGNVELVVEAQP